MSSKEWKSQPSWRFLKTSKFKYCRGLLISSLHVPECSFHIGYKWVLTKVSMTSGKYWGKINSFVLEYIGSPLRYTHLEESDYTKKGIYSLITFNVVTTLPCSTLIFNYLIISVRYKCANGFPTTTSFPWSSDFSAILRLTSLLPTR